MTDQQRRFLEMLLRDPKRNAKRAALAAGCSEKSARVLGPRWRKVPEVAAALAQAEKTTEKATGKATNENGVKVPRTPKKSTAMSATEDSEQPQSVEKEEPLSDRHERFCREYVVDGNATRAYLRVYGTSSYAAAMTDAGRLLRNAQIQTRIKELREERNRRLDVNADKVLRVLAAQAFFDPRDLLDADGRFKPLNELDPDTATAVAGMSTKHSVTGDAKDEVVVFTNIKFADRTRAAELLGKNLKLWTDKVEVNDDVSYVDRLKALRERLREERRAMALIMNEVDREKD